MKIFDLSYHDLMQVLAQSQHRRHVRRRGSNQTRHSHASMGLCLSLRSMQEAQSRDKRGSKKSVCRRETLSRREQPAGQFGHRLLDYFGTAK